MFCVPKKRMASEVPSGLEDGKEKYQALSYSSLDRGPRERSLDTRQGLSKSGK